MGTLWAVKEITFFLFGYLCCDDREGVNVKEEGESPHSVFFSFADSVAGCLGG